MFEIRNMLEIHNNGIGRERSAAFISKGTGCHMNYYAPRKPNKDLLSLSDII